METINLGRSGDLGVIQFNEIDDLRDICDIERTNWTRLASRTRDESVINLCHSQLFKWQCLLELIENGDLSKIQSQYISGFVDTFANDNELITFDSNTGSAIVSGKTDQNFHWPRFNDHDEVAKRKDQFLSAIVAIRSITDRPDPRVLHLEMMANQMSEIIEKISDLEIRSSEALSEIDKKTIEFQNIQKSSEKILASDTQSIREELKITSQSATENYQNFLQKFSDSISEYQNVIDAAKNAEILERPIRRWVAERKAHAKNAAQRLKAAAAFGFMTAIFTPVTVLIVFDKSWRFLPYESLNTARLIFSGVSGLTVLTFGLWASRIAVRSYMAEEHLKNDASNRIAITNAFIKLQASVGATDDDRKILLNTIMRPSQDGIVHDDGLPPTMPAAIVAKALDQAASLAKR